MGRLEVGPLALLYTRRSLNWFSPVVDTLISYKTKFSWGGGGHICKCTVLCTVCTLYSVQYTTRHLFEDYIEL